MSGTEYGVEGLYAHGWELVCTEMEFIEALDRLAEYRENEPGTAFRVKRITTEVEGDKLTFAQLDALRHLDKVGPVLYVSLNIPRRELADLVKRGLVAEVPRKGPQRGPYRYRITVDGYDALRQAKEEA